MDWVFIPSMDFFPIEQAGYKITRQKSIAFQYSNDKHTKKKKTRETISFTIFTPKKEEEEEEEAEG